MTFEVSRLSARYSRIEVCHDISFEVGNGEFLAILGANGAGKSSLLGAIAGTVAVFQYRVASPHGERLLNIVYNWISSGGIGTD